LSRKKSNTPPDRYRDIYHLARIYKIKKLDEEPTLRTKAGHLIFAVMDMLGLRYPLRPQPLTEFKNRR